MQRYMCSRFFIDFPDISEQQRKLEGYLQNHFAGMEDKRYEYLVTLRQVVDESTVCLMGHERRQTLALISALALRVMAEQNAIPALSNITCYYQPAPYVRDVNFSNYYVAQVQSPMATCSNSYQTWLPCSWAVSFITAWKVYVSFLNLYFDVSRTFINRNVHCKGSVLCRTALAVEDNPFFSVWSYLLGLWAVHLKFLALLPSRNRSLFC